MSAIKNWIMDMEEDLEDGFTREQMKQKHGYDGVYQYDSYHGYETLNNRRITNLLYECGSERVSNYRHDPD